MASKRPIRYKPPKPPEPPGRKAGSPEHQLIGESSRGSSKLKWIAGGVGIVLLALIFALLTYKPQSETRPPAKKPEAPEAPVKKPNTWTQNYSTTFRYGFNAVTFVNVRVGKLNKSQSSVTYSLLVRNSRGKVAWLKQAKQRFQMTFPGVESSPSSTTLTRSSTQYRLSVNFKWPRKLLYKGSCLRVSIPGVEGEEKVRLGLDVPRDHVGLYERKGLSCLTR